jgi:Tol biopolymer transport system component
MASLFRTAPVLAACAALATLSAAALEPAALFADDRDDTPPAALIGYTELRTDLPGGRAANIKTERAVVVKADGTGRRVLAEELTREAGYWTQFVGWSPDGNAASLYRGWVNEENAKWEEEHKTFRPTPDNGRSGGYLVDLATGKATKRVKTKRERKAASLNLVYGLCVSPDGKRSAFTRDYQLYLADGEGASARHVRTGMSFNFLPEWSPDGTWLLFLAGEHYDCHPHILKPEGTGLKKLASRGGYRGVIQFLDVYDFHDGSSDYPVWAPDSKSIFYTALVGRNVELFRATLDGKRVPLTDSPAGVLHYHPEPSPDGKWLVYGSKRDGVRQLYVMRLSDKKECRITDLAKGRAAMWPHWHPRAAP